MPNNKLYAAIDTTASVLPHVGGATQATTNVGIVSLFVSAFDAWGRATDDPELRKRFKDLSQILDHRYDHLKK
jgi:hypothetical protein